MSNINLYTQNLCDYIYTAISLDILKLLSPIWIIKVEMILKFKNLWI